MSNSIYGIFTCRSEAETGDCAPAEVTDLIMKYGTAMTEGYAVCWLNHAVRIGRVSGGMPVFADDSTADYAADLVELRLFDAESELYVWRKDGGFGYRVRRDCEGNVMEYVQARQPLWGTRVAGEGNSWSTIEEDRGIRFEVPFTGLELTPLKRLCLVTRNYIGYNEIDQAGYVDCRFVGFEQAGGAK
jgi:CRISPR-associated protein (TIGR03984 family)